MKNLKMAALTVLFLCGMMCYTSCDDEADVYGSTTKSGRVECNPNEAKNGDVVKLTMEKQQFNIGDIGIEIGTSETINGKNVVKSVVYYVDNVPVAESVANQDKYSANYTVSGLTAGKHVVSAQFVSNFKHYEITSNVTTDTLTVLE